MIRVKTVRTGERVAVWSLNGKVRLVDGPKRLWLYRQSVEPLAYFSADANQYLVVRYQDGRQKHLPGPASLWFDPVSHTSIHVADAVPLNAHEAVVVYNRGGNGAVERRVIMGPTQFVPAESEWIHPFSWHGADPNDPRRKVPRALKFSKLRTIPDQMYFDVEEVRTADDALVCVKLMLFFELEDINRMLDQTHDPIADFINALSADVIDFVSGLSFERFKQETEKLNELETYRNLLKRAARIGYRINNVVYRGYAATKKLQAMHDNAIETRTALQLESETEEQAQELADMRQAREGARAREQQAMELAQAEHERQVLRVKHAEKLRQRDEEAQQELKTRGQKDEARLRFLQQKNEQQLAFLGTVRGFEVDMTRYLVAQYQNPDRLIRIDDGGGANLHLHTDQ